MNNTITLRHLTRNSTHVIPQNGDRKLISWPYRFCDVISPYVFPITTTGTAFRLELTTLARALDAVNNTASRLRRTGMQSPQHRSSACAHYSLHKPPSGLPYTTPLDSGSGTAAQTAVAEAGHDGGWLQDCVTTGTPPFICTPRDDSYDPSHGTDRYCSRLLVREARRRKKTFYRVSQKTCTSLNRHIDDTIQDKTKCISNVPRVAGNED